MQVLVQRDARNYAKRTPAANQHGRPTESVGLLPFSPRPPQLAQTSPRQRSLGRSNINSPPGSPSALLGLRVRDPLTGLRTLLPAQFPSPPRTPSPTPRWAALASSFSSPARHLFTPLARAPSRGQGKSCKQAPGTAATAFRPGPVAHSPGVQTPPSQPEFL